MSRLTKYLKQKAQITLMERDREGNPILDDYGDPKYRVSNITAKCRRERDTKDVLTTGGAASVSTTKYYFDTSINIDIGDKVDGKVVLTVTDYINDMGISEGWLVTV